MRPHLAVAGVVLLVLAGGCSGDDDKPPQTSPSDSPSAVRTNEAASPSGTPTPTQACSALIQRKVAKAGAGFVIELNVMSGLPNPAWRLSKADGVELQRLLRTTSRGIDRDGLDDLGGYVVTADRDASARFLQGLDLPETFWLQGDNKLSRFLNGIAPCSALAP